MPAYQLRAIDHEGEMKTLHDPYAFAPSMTDFDLHLFGEGKLLRGYEKLGAQVREVAGVRGTNFAVWAPNARSVSVVGDFNQWDGRLHPMRTLGAAGIWELFIPGVEDGAHYKYELRTEAGYVQLRADPVAQATEVPPQTASIVYRAQHEWQDEGWIE